ncbi:MAG: undecaprenyldiphospho-muramoylpentapeptide beta-N-acetylglucosaminyltransferase [Spirochaetaceae bacterium]|jgi:UDP-N-acetylglucosamine--N-acetylmuramyl-(pentapeptide) pyrophosphoryl-undecaprenol N-acetylglucosamine transferase|nr:undecaprenyldiphospho-muramoylpentapeptide beta-N-acetylglucosaminyltransferase [Spirochaetaceae bacterium]
MNAGMRGMITADIITAKRRTVIKIAFTGGGTGGHIYPALAVIAALKEISNPDIFWIGQKTGMDKSIVEAAGLRFYGISAGKLRRYFSLRNIADIFNIIRGFIEARKILAKEMPALLFSKGGFVSVPPVIAAASLKISVHTHESDVSPGLATKINTFFAERVWTAYEKTELFFKPQFRKKVRRCGNPVRSVFLEANALRGRIFLEKKAGQTIPEDKKILLVLGGSQGAKEINDLVTACLGDFTKYFFVVHQTGYVLGDTDTSPAGNVSKNYLPLAYMKDELPDVLAAAHLVLGRSGAGTVWEAAAAGVPMLLIPLCGSGTRGDQVENARYFTGEGAALMLIHPKPEELMQTILDLIKDENGLAALAAASKRAGKPDAAKIIADEICLKFDMNV